jgi:uncharacterized protein (DUF305 family)
MLKPTAPHARLTRNVVVIILLLLAAGAFATGLLLPIQAAPSVQDQEATPTPGSMMGNNMMGQGMMDSGMSMAQMGAIMDQMMAHMHGMMGTMAMTGTVPMSSTMPMADMLPMCAMMHMGRSMPMTGTMPMMGTTPGMMPMTETMSMSSTMPMSGAMPMMGMTAMTDTMHMAYAGTMMQMMGMMQMHMGCMQMMMGAMLSGGMAGGDMMGSGMMGQPPGMPMAGDVPFDATFIDGMIEHHQDAIDMAEMALEEAEHEEIRVLAEEIIAAQTTEIEQMQGWRSEWYPDLAPTGGMQMGMGEMMVSEDESVPFDQRFIEAMISHHQGAISMAEMALTQAEHGEIRTLAEEVIAAQTAEIEQMQGWLAEWYGVTNE